MILDATQYGRLAHVIALEQVHAHMATGRIHVSSYWLDLYRASQYRPMPGTLPPLKAKALPSAEIVDAPEDLVRSLYARRVPELPDSDDPEEDEPIIAVPLEDGSLGAVEEAIAEKPKPKPAAKARKNPKPGTPPEPTSAA